MGFCEPDLFAAPKMIGETAAPAACRNVLRVVFVIAKLQRLLYHGLKRRGCEAPGGSPARAPHTRDGPPDVCIRGRCGPDCQPPGRAAAPSSSGTRSWAESLRTFPLARPRLRYFPAGTRPWPSPAARSDR